jgi:prepilin-type N-terminal cleavage/methylation domain-containing protein
MSRNSKLGFSLIELSVVILVIGILVVGITQGSRIISEAKLKSARALTDSSPVNANTNLMLWFDSVSEKSFDSSASNANKISNWYDLNLQSVTKNNATQNTSDNQPVYYRSRINGLPAINFDGNASYMDFDGIPLVRSNYTIFVVEQRRSNSAKFFIGGTSTSTNNQNLHLGYTTDTTLTFRQWGNDYNISPDITNYSAPIARIHAFRFSSDIGKNYHLNSISKTLTDVNTPVATQGLTGFPGASIGRRATGNYYNGDIGEVIMFTRYLKDSERQAIESYLSQKWGIKLS